MRGTCNVYTDWCLMCSRVPKDTYYDTQQEEADLDQEKAAKEKPGTSMCVCVVCVCVCVLCVCVCVCAHKVLFAYV